MNPAVRLILQVLLPIALLAGGYMGYRYFVDNPPQASKAPPQPVRATPVEVSTLHTRDYRIVLQSHGSIAARSQIDLVPQVSGTVMSISPGLRRGGQVDEGEVLVQIDPVDYEIAVRDARAPLLKARATLAEERARAVQAEKDWKTLNPNTPASPLVLRTPQVEAAKAELLAAEARLERAELNLSRTALLAPFNGRVHRASVDAGQFVQAGQALASVFATDVLEVRMPLNARQLAQARLPGDAENEPMRATLSLKQGGRVWRYPALVVRSDSAIDTATRQLFVIAEVGGDSDAGDDKPTLKVGQFVEAGIEGRLLESVFVIPRRLLLQDNEVFLANQGKLERRRVSVVWQNAQEAVIEAGLAEGEILVMTTLGNATAGTRLKYPGAPN